MDAVTAKRACVLAELETGAHVSKQIYRPFQPPPHAILFQVWASRSEFLESRHVLPRFGRAGYYVDLRGQGLSGKLLF